MPNAIQQNDDQYRIANEIVAELKAKGLLPSDETWLYKLPATFPQIPSIKFIVTKPNPLEPMYLREEFESHCALSHWAYTKCEDICTQVEEEYKRDSFEINRRNRGEYTVIDYCSDNLDRLLGENGYTLERVKV